MFIGKPHVSNYPNGAMVIVDHRGTRAIARGKIVYQSSRCDAAAWNAARDAALVDRSDVHMNIADASTRLLHY